MKECMKATETSKLWRGMHLKLTSIVCSHGTLPYRVMDFKLLATKMSFAFYIIGLRSLLNVLLLPSTVSMVHFALRFRTPMRALDPRDHFGSGSLLRAAEVLRRIPLCCCYHGSHGKENC